MKIRINLVDRNAVFIDPEKVGPARFDVSGLTVRAVAHGLSGVARFAHQTPRGVSDAEHSVLLAEWLPRVYPKATRQTLRYALLHDACEGLGVGDVHHQIKPLYAQELRGLEHDLLDAIWNKFEGTTLGVPEDAGAPVHTFDKMIGAWEASQVWPGVPIEGVGLVTGLEPKQQPMSLQYWDAPRAKAEWLHAWFALDGRDV